MLTTAGGGCKSRHPAARPKRAETAVPAANAQPGMHYDRRRSPPFVAILGVFDQRAT
jgi:hypothetical protein